MEETYNMTRIAVCPECGKVLEVCKCHLYDFYWVLMYSCSCGFTDTLNSDRVNTIRVPIVPEVDFLSKSNIPDYDYHGVLQVIERGESV